MSRLPMVVPATGLPQRVTIYEVGPRDGLQAERTVLPTEVKVAFVRRLVAAGLGTVEATSFVSPKWIPQLGDAAEVLAGIDLDAARYPVLVPNERGLDRALAAGAREIAVFASATESFAKNNLNRTLDESLEMFAPVLRRASEAGLRARGYISMCFGDPWEGPVAPEQVCTVAQRLLELGVHTLSLGDTIGVATTGHVLRLLELLRDNGIPADRTAVHFHDTYGQALSNVYAALTAGITEFDSSAGGIGGCPYAGSATGNLATEDLVWLLNGLGIEHGAELDELVRISTWMAGQLGRPSPSRVVAALADEADNADDAGNA